MKRLLTFLASIGLTAAAAVQAALIPVTEDIAAGQTITWTANNEYRLDTVVYVQPGATLVIQPGTVIRGARNVTIAKPGIPQLVSALWVTRGGKIMAEGTKQNPIIFTSENDPLDGSIAPTQTALWGGVVIMGRATINSAKHAAGNVATPKFDKYEGCQDDPATGLPYPEHTFGGADDNDNSGVLRYVSIRHCGLNFQQDAELNCLTVGAVGRGTTLEFVEVFAGSDDGFEWWGGTVNSKYLVSAFIEDDNFDTDQGYRGQNQFWFGIKAPTTAATADSRGIESDGDLNQSAFDETPLNQWSASNVTLIGRGKTITQTDRNVAWNTRDEDAPIVFNSIFAEWNQGLLLDSDGLRHHNTTMLAHIQNNIWDVTTASRNANGTFLFETAGLNNNVTAAALGGISYSNDGVLDPRPQAASAAYQNVLAGAPVAVNFRGAFSGPADNWADGWTALSKFGYLKAAVGKPVVPVTQDIAAGSTVTWTANNEYRLDTVVYVQDGATLNIEPGTVIRGARNVTIAKPGIPQLVSALWVTRGGKLNATGTRENPIIFTSENDPLDGSIAPTQTALWGGVVIMGKATINSAKHAAGNVATPKFDKYEGCQDDPATGLPYPEHTFGGADDNDNSGVLRYVSIRHCGLNFQQDAELNCLTMGAVGRGTTLEYVEVFAGSDDGFEWWGGTVNSKYLVSAFIEDDNFDTDQGYRGQNQFWFGIKAPTTAATADSRGIESDGDLNQSATGETPLNQWSASNVTLIGRGKTITQTDRNVAWNTRDEDAPNVYNSIFAEWNQGLLLDSDGLHHHNVTMLAHIQNNIWDVTTASRNANGTFLFDTAAHNNTVGAAMLGAISYANDNVLDPRPLRGSPAFLNVLAGAPTAVTYRGAFSGPSDNWADGWTAISAYGYLKAAPAVANAPELAISFDGQNAVVSFPTQTGFTYQVQSMTDVAGTTWGNEGAAVPGTASTVNVPVAATGDAKFLRVRVN